MALTELADRVVQDLASAISTELTNEERVAVSKIVRNALRDASGKTMEACRDAAVICCGPEADLAHKIQEQMDKKRDMLIANLMSMR